MLGRPFVAPLIAVIAGLPTLVAPGARVAEWTYTAGFALLVVLAWRRAARGPLIAAALTVWLAGDLVYSWLVWRHGEPDGVSIADVLWVSAYPLLAAGLIRMVRQRAPGRLREAALDVLAMAVVVAALFWQFLVLPGFNDDGVSAADMVLAFYPFGDLLLVAAGLLLVLSPGTSRGLLAYLTTALTVTLLVDVILSLSPMWFPEVAYERFDAVLLVANSLFVAVLWHPESARKPDLRTADAARLHPARVIFLGIALLALPAMADLRISGMALGRGTVMVAMLLLTGIVLTRFTLVVRAQERARSDLAHRATHDMLTGLVNRQELHARLAASLAAGDQPVVHFLDLNGFKPVNDRYGHAAGDHVLTEVARRLRATVRNAETVARLGGDEFVVVTETGDAEAMTERLREAVTAAITHESETLHVGVSIGVARSADLPAPTSDTLLAAADAAMYKNKINTRGAATASSPTLSRVGAQSTARV